jgi:hypothetical protein
MDDDNMFIVDQIKELINSRASSSRSHSSVEDAIVFG